MDFRFPDVQKDVAESDSGTVIYPVGALDLWIESEDGRTYTYTLCWTANTDLLSARDQDEAGYIITGAGPYDDPQACFVGGVLEANKYASFAGLPYRTGID